MPRTPVKGYSKNLEIRDLVLQTIKFNFGILTSSNYKHSYTIYLQQRGKIRIFEETLQNIGQTSQKRELYGIL